MKSVLEEDDDLYEIETQRLQRIKFQIWDCKLLTEEEKLEKFKTILVKRFEYFQKIVLGFDKIY